MKLLLAGFVLLLATASVAQPYTKPADGTVLRSVQADPPKADNVPAGGCMPIGLTARGDLVFPMQCRELIERERGPVAQEKQQVSEPRVQQEPSMKGAALDRQDPSGQITMAEKDLATTGLTPPLGRKKWAKGERHKKPEKLARPDLPLVTGSVTR